MPNMRSLDESLTNGWLPPTPGVWEFTPILDSRSATPNWPFLYSYDGTGRCTVNAAPSKSKYAQAEEVSKALF